MVRLRANFRRCTSSFGDVRQRIALEREPLAHRRSRETLQKAPDTYAMPFDSLRMDAEVDEYRLVEYMMILFSVSVTQCSLANRQDILAVAAKGLPRIKPPFTKLAEEQMEELRNPQKPLPPCE